MKKTVRIVSALCVLAVIFFASACKKTTSGLNIAEETVRIEVGKTAELTVERNGLKGNIVYSTDNPAVISIDENGVIKGLTQGRGRVEAAIGDNTDSCTVIVVPSADDSQKAFPYISLSQNDVILNVGDEFSVEPRLVSDGDRLEAEFTCASSDETLGTATVENGSNVKITAKGQGNFEVTVSCEYDGDIFQKSLSVSVVRDAVLTLGANSAEFDLLHGKNGRLIEQTACIAIEEARLDGAKYTGDVTVSPKDPAAVSWVKSRIVGDSIEITVSGIGETSLCVSISDGQSSYTSEIAVSARTPLGITGASYSLTEQTVGSGQVSVYGVSVAKKDNSFAFTSDYVKTLKEKKVKAVKVWLKDIAAVIQPNWSLPSGTYEWQGTEENGWYALHMRNIRYGRNNPSDGGTAYNYNYTTNNPRYSYWDDVLTPDDLLRFSVKFVDASKLSGYMYVETFGDDYPVVSGRDFTESEVNFGGGVKATAYRVSFEHSDCSHTGANAQNCYYNKGFTVSGAYIADMKAKGFEKVRIFYKTDGCIIPRVGYDALEYECSRNEWLSAKTEWTQMKLENRTLQTEFSDIPLDKLTDLHFCVPANLASGFPTYFEFYLTTI